MTEPSNRPHDRPETDEEPPTFVVPGAPAAGEESTAEQRATETQELRDLGSASRSCMAIIAVLLIVALLICVFLVWGVLQ